MENNNGKGIFYGVIGVATLIVAIIGATFAYFSAQTASSQYVAGTAATASLAVYVERLTGFSVGEGADKTLATAQYTMVPQLDQGLGHAIKGVQVENDGKKPGEDGYEPKYGAPCIDATGSLVCQIYKITVHNTGSAAITVSGDIEFYATGAGDTVQIQNGAAEEPATPGGNGAAPDTTGATNKMANLKWARLKDPVGITGNGDDITGLGIDYLYSEINALGVSQEGVVANGAMPTELEDYTTGLYDTRANGTKTYYANYINKDLGSGNKVEYVNKFLYGRPVTTSDIPALDSNIDIGGVSTKVTKDIHNRYRDLLAANDHVVWEHGVYTDLIDPTDDLIITRGTVLDTDNLYTDTVTTPTAEQKTQGSYELNAYGQEGEAKAYYIVVWISENLAEQNTVDFGTFAGQVTFTSSGGSGATSTFTAAYSG